MLGNNQNALLSQPGHERNYCLWTHDFFQRGWSWLKLMLINWYRFLEKKIITTFTRLDHLNYMFSYNFLEFMLETLIGLKFTAVVFSIPLWFREVRFYFNFKSNKRFLCCSRVEAQLFIRTIFFIAVLISMHFHYAQIMYSSLAAYINLSDPRTIKNAVEANAMFIQIKAEMIFLLL